MLAPAIPFLAHLRTPVAPERLLETAVARIRSGASWIKVLADAPGADGNMLAATPTYPSELIAELCAAVHREGGRVAAHTTGPSAPALVSAELTQSSTADGSPRTRSRNSEPAVAHGLPPSERRCTT